MRSAIACVVIVGAAACSSSRHGTEFVVSWNQKPTQVLMFVSTSRGSAIAIQPMGGSVPVPGTGWQLANEDPLDVTASAGSAMTFFYEGSDVITKVYAVGIDGSGNAAYVASGAGPYDNPARLTEIVQYRLDLTGSNEVKVWGQPSCLQVGSDFMLDDLANDPDCDGFRTNDPSQECVPDVYLGQRGPKLREASCTMRLATGPGAQTAACVLGGPSCRDGQGPGSDCDAPTAYCTPASACGYAFDTLDDVVSAGVAGSGATSPLTVLRCSFEGTVGSARSFTPCTGSDGNAVAVTAGNRGGTAVTCQSPLLESAPDGWGKSVELGFGSAGSAVEAGVKLQVDLTAPCKLTFTLKPDSSNSFTLPPMGLDGTYALGALLTAGVTIPAPAGGGSGSGTLRGVAVPLVIQLETDGCSAASAGTCQVVLAETGTSTTGLDFNNDESLRGCLESGMFPPDTPPPGAH